MNAKQQARLSTFVQQAIQDQETKREIDPFLQTILSPELPTSEKIKLAESKTYQDAREMISSWLTD
jgi:hypothetical protein